VERKKKKQQQKQTKQRTGDKEALGPGHVKIKQEIYPPEQPTPPTNVS
jgi:hypothetical protein